MQYFKGAKASGMVRSAMIAVFTAILFLLNTGSVFGHGTQVAYCVTDAGTIRVYIEHWHGNILPTQVMDALVVINVTDSSTGMTTTSTTIPNGVVWDTTIDNLPDCKGPLNVVSACPGQANTDNDWVYWDFAPPACFVNLEIEVAGVIGSESYYFDEACSALYPVSFVDSFIDCVPPAIECPDEITAEVSTSNCEANVTGLAPTILFDDCTPVEDIVLSYNITGATTRSGLGDANGLFAKGTSTVTYSAEDDTGKISSCSFNVIVDDTNPPNLNCPSNLILECGDPNNANLIADWLNLVVASDQCGVASIANNYSGTTEKGTHIVTFTATDECDNVSNCQASIIIRDREDPILNCPADITIECGAPNNDAVVQLWLESVTGIDACSDDITITNNYVGNFFNDCGSTGTRTVTFRADDGCGNIETCQAVITRQDNTPPDMMMKPQDLVGECINSNGAQPARNNWLSMNGGAMAVDDCDPNLSWTRTLLSRTELCGYTWEEEYLFTVTDDCGNSTTATAVFTAQDLTPPNLNLRADVTINCSTANPAQLENLLTNFGTVNDVCSLNSDIDVDYVLFNSVSGCGGTSTETYLFTATDECGNQATDLFSFTIRDTAIPTWSGVPGTLVIECGDEEIPSIIQQWIQDIADASFDGCGGDVDVSHNWDGTLNEGCNQNTVVTFTFEDECGNSRTLNRTIAVRDQINPIVLNCPEDFTVNVDVDVCGSNVIFPTPVFYDQCTKPLTVTQTLGLASGSTFPVGSTLIRFDARDGCNRLARCQFSITVVDTDTPSVNCPSTVEACTDLGRCDWLGDASVNPITMDNCAVRTIQYEISGATTLSRRNGDAEGRRFNVGVSQVCYYVTDTPGNEVSCCFDVVVTDCESPRITCPTDRTVECDGAGNLAALNAWLTDVSSSDNCDVETETNMLYNSISACGDAETMVYEFKAIDEEGNESICYASFIIEDTTDPVITTMASDGNSNCDEADSDLLDWLNTNGGAQANDLCGNVSWSNDFGGSAMTACSGVTSLSVTFTATDQCGNTASTTADFVVEDEIEPSIECPTHITLSCGNILNDAIIELWLLSATGTDNCTEATITHDFPGDYTLDCGDAGEHEVVFTATDACGNTDECTAFIIIEDEVVPSFTIRPQDVTIECDGAGNLAQVNSWVTSNGGGMAQDDCDANPTWMSNEVGDDPACGQSNTLEYEFFITDECDNVNSALAFIHIEDTTPPDLTAPADIAFSCSDDIATEIEDWASTAVATDICGDVLIDYELYNSISGCGDSYSESYLFIATDDCGLQSTAIASIVVEDSTMPSIACPDDLTIQCGAPNNPQFIASWLESIDGMDGCGDVSFSNNYTGLLPDNCGGSLTVMFTAVDDCGNSTTCTADIIMEDNAIPDFFSCPEDMTINVDVDACGSNPIFSTPLAMDNCDVSVSQTAGPASGTPFPLGTSTIEFTATDACGNAITCSFDITVEDSDIPQIFCPSNEIFVCADPGECSWISEDIGPIQGVENCPDYSITYVITGASSGTGVNDASGTELELGTSTICYTIEDATGNESTCCFDVLVGDCENPELICPSDITVECNGSDNAADLADWLDEFEASDNCGGSPSLSNILFTEVATCGSSLTWTYEFTAMDEAGNMMRCYADFTIEDTTEPSIDTEADDLVVECDGSPSDQLTAWLNNQGGATASDICGSVTWSNNYTGGLSNLCGDTGEVIVIFTATDDCGNEETSSASFIVEDTIEPEITCPLDIILECSDPANDAIIENWLASANGTDACGEVTISNNYGTIFAAACGETGVYTIDFVATDACGLESTCQATITLEDNTRPSIVVAPIDITIECADPGYTATYNNWLMTNASAVGSDDCGDVIWSYVPLDFVDDCGTAGSFPHQWTVTDACGNTNTAIATVFTIDTTNPVLDTPADLTVTCDGAGNESAKEDWLDTAGATDECADVSIEYALNNTISLCGGGTTEEYLFTATDDCGNETTGFASFTIADETIPAITCPDPLNLECGEIGNDQLIAAWLSDATATDECSNVEIIHNYTGLLPADCDGSITVIFTATDDCGNTSTCTSMINMDDTIDPTFVNCPEDLTINVDVDNCSANPIFSAPIADDNCEVVVIQTDGPIPGSTFDLGANLVEFLAMDACGNTATCQFNIIVIDSDEPTILCPSNSVLVCTDTGACTWTSVDIGPSLGVENCPGYTIEYTVTGTTSATGMDDASGVEFNLGLSTVCYTIMDTSDNVSTCCFDVIVEDCEKPMLTCPDPMTIECDSEADLPGLIATWAATASSTDNCNGDVDISYQEFNHISACGATEELIYLFVATDDAGNQTTCLSNFVIEDTTMPEIIEEAENLTLECDGGNQSTALQAWLNNRGGARATDSCLDELNWSNNFTGDLSNICGTNGAVEVIFTATDACGNSNTSSATFTIEDTTSPVLTCPVDITLECSDPLNEVIIESWLSEAIAIDACEGFVDVSNSYPDVLVEACGQTGVYTITFTSVDDCGNSSDCLRTITLEDNTDPGIVVAPQDITIECADPAYATIYNNWLMSNASAIGSDDCGSVSWSYEALDFVGSCGTSGSLPHIWTVTDQCGNTSTAIASVYTIDTTLPELTTPIDLTVTCDGDGNTDEKTDWLETVSSTDDCGDTSISYILNNTISACGGGSTEEYLFTATDDCGNETTGFASFTISDMTVPMIVCPPTLSLECGDEGNDQVINAWLLDATSTDECSNVQITHNYTGLLPADCDGSLTVIFIATDDCGNASTCEGVITMDDTTLPTFVNCPTDLTINVDVDNCSSNPIFSTPIAEDNCMVVVEQTEGPASGSPFDLGTNLVEFLATDACGNTATCQFNIIVIDSDEPIILCPSNVVTACTDVGLCTWRSVDIAPSFGLENCPDYTIEYVITGNTMASGMDDATGEVFELGLSRVCYTIMDTSDNISICCFDVLVEDCEKPQLDCPDLLIVECDSEADLNAQISTWAATASATDNCDSDVEITYQEYNNISACGATQEGTYLFIATDDAGNQSTCLASFVTEDTTMPEIINEAVNLTLECNGGNQSTALQAWLNDLGGASASDACQDELNWTNNFTGDLATICGTNGSILVEFTATDACGNANTTSAIFTIEDTTSPKLTTPSDITLECADPLNEVIIDSWLAEAVAIDACEGFVDVFHDYPDVFLAACGSTGEYVVTFTTEDACGNIVESSQTITIEDTTMPAIITQPSDLLLECADGDNGLLIDQWELDFGDAEASDDCSLGELSWSILSSVDIASCGDTQETIYTFQVSDDCGNTNTVLASVIIEDTTAPVLTVPDDLVEECGAITIDLTTWQDQAIAEDLCGAASIDVVLWDTQSACGGTFGRTYLFTATDECGNESTGLANYNFEDTTPPLIDCPDDLILICGNEDNDQIVAAWLETAVASDPNNCSEVSIEYELPGNLSFTLLCDGGEISEITFTATDACGNETTCTANITMLDESPPTFVDCPTNLTVNVDVDLCETNVVYSTPIALDNCDENVDVVLVNGPASGTAFDLGTSTVVFEATDDCGNVSTCSFEITVIDSDIPSIECPSNYVYVCTNDNSCTWISDEQTNPLYNDNCPGLEVYYEISGATTASNFNSGQNTVAGDGIIFEIGTSVVTYTIADETGNSSTCSFTVVVEDCEAPTIECVDQLNVPCGLEDIPAWIAAISASVEDNCSDEADMIVDAVLLTDFSSCGNTIEQVYQFTVTDEAGNSSTCLATYESDDNVNPIIDSPAENLTLECNGSNQSSALQAWLNNIAGASASDACSGPVVWTNNFASDLISSCGPNGGIEVIFTATDACGNQSTSSAMFTIEDTTPPVLTCPSDITLDCNDPFNEAIIEAWLNGASSIDDCEGSIAISHNYPDIFVDACGLTGEYTVTFTSIDACANASNCERTITIIDEIQPVINVEPIDLLLECADGQNASMINDWEDNFGGASATDGCSDEPLIWEILSTNIIPTCGDNNTINYIFQVSDNCGNTNTATASVITNDTTSPMLTLPENQVEECGNISVSLNAWQKEATATDACGDVKIDVVLWNTVSGCGGTESQTYLFTAIDECGNESTGFADYELIDSVDPIIFCLDPLMLVCGDENNDQIISNWLETITGIDQYGCSDVISSYSFPGGLPDPLDCEGGTGIEVIFTVEDACGNSTSCSQYITMDDEEKPYFLNCPSNLIVNADVDLCEANVVYSTPIALDNCDENVEVNLVQGPASGSPFELGSNLVVFVATDDCGNTQICRFEVLVIDSDIPTIDCPSNDLVHCTDAGSCTWIADDSTDPLSIDNCDGLEIVYEISGATTASDFGPGVNLISDDQVVFNLGTSTVIYTIEDGSGNVSTCMYDVVIEDCEKPTIDCFDELNVACGEEDIEAWMDAIAASVTDNCDQLSELTVNIDLLTDISSCGESFERVYAFTVTDQAGNFSSCFSKYETDDQIAPEIIDEAQNLTLECDGSNQSTALLAWLNNRGGATAQDLCSEPVVWTHDYEGDLNNTCGINGTIDVTFTATDQCGNSNSTTATFTIQDTMPPKIACPDNLSLECGDDLNEAVILNWLETASALDECDGVIITRNNFSDVYEEGCGMTGTHTVTFTATDACGNQSECTRLVEIIDTTNPIITTQPNDLILACADPENSSLVAEWEGSFGGAAAMDNCSDEDLKWNIINTLQTNACGITSTTLYTFEVRDNCGNSSVVEASVIIEDKQAPILMLPEDQLEECAEIVVQIEDWKDEVTATDECGEVNIEVSLWNSISSCGDGVQEVYLFIATDECGNQSTGFAEYRIMDSSPPVMTQEAEMFIAECNGASNSAEILSWLNNNGFAEAEDACGEITWTNDYGEIDADCGTTGLVLVTFTATDECGNSTSTTAEFEINDTTAPTWQILPQDLEIECDGTDDPMGQINAWLNTAGGADLVDDCSFITINNNFETIDLECNQEGGVEVSFTASDACGNATTASAQLTITDDVPPIILSPALDMIVECDPLTNQESLDEWLEIHGGATSADACSPILEWTYNLVETIEACGTTVSHIYAFQVTDACGNVSNNTNATFTIEDTTSPIIVESEDYIAECDGEGNESELEEWLSNHGGLEANDPCSEVFSWEYDLISFEENCGITNISLYRFTVYDECGNSSTSESRFIIEDTSSPEIVGGEDEDIEDCDNPPLGNYPVFDFWLSNNAGATASDICGSVQWINNYDPSNWVFTCGNTRYVDVIFTAIDVCGNLSSIEKRFGIGDVSGPEFENCPRPAIIVNAPDQWCSAYANFELPQANDNCGGTSIITRTDDTGLESGDLFPIGLTILTYQAEDECGNTSTCELKIVVNDFHTEPVIECPEDITLVADAALCGTTGVDLAPVAFEDNCPEYMAVIYEIVDEKDQIIYSGVNDASGQFFPQGDNVLNYAALDQPIILITEIIQDGITTGVEITNFGPAHMDISCLEITREDPLPESHNVPNGTILDVGEVYVQYFENIPAGTAAGYYISFLDKVIDGVSINGYAGISYPWTGGVFGENIYRLYIWDHDDDIDFEVSDPCILGSFGAFNPELEIMPANGLTIGLQEGEPGVSTCSTQVTVNDVSAPFCAEYDTTIYQILAPVIIEDGCTQIMFDVSEDMTVGDIQIMDLALEISNVEELIASLTSPEGTSVVLFGGSCEGSSSVSLSFSDGASQTMGSVICDPPGGGHMYEPVGSFKNFFNESAQGQWMLEIKDKGLDEGIILEANLEILTLVPFAQENMVLEAEEGLCTAYFDWQHPMFSDNCCFGNMSVEFLSDDPVDLPDFFGDFAQGSMTGSHFGVGTTTVVYTSVDQFGNESKCSFDVEVVDNEPPTFRPEDCEDRTFYLTSNDCAVPMNALNLDLQSVRDNCGDVDVSISPSFDDGIPEGDHDFTITLEDEFGNRSECTFTVTVIRDNATDPGAGIACNGTLNVSLGPDCTATITPDMVLADAESYGCTEDFCVRLTDEFGNEIGSSDFGTNVLTEDHIGQTIIVEVCINCEDSNCCWAFINVENKLIPEVVCPADIEISCNQTYDISVTGQPVVETCEQEIYFNYEDNLIDMGMCADPAALLIRTWYITDESGNTITCEQIITIMDFNLEDVVIPDDVFVTDTYTCEEVANDQSLVHPDSTGYPTIGGVPITETADGLCSFFWNWDDLILNNCEGSYEILRRWVIHDMCEELDHLENPLERYQLIKVLDSTPPVFENCPEDITVNAGSLNCIADVYLNDYLPEIYDECGSVEELFITVNPGTVYESPEGSGNYYLSSLLPGSHQVRIRAKDQCSNFSLCEFNIEVEDLLEPNVICEGEIVVSLSNSGVSNIQAEVLDDGSFDYCTDVHFQIYRMDTYCFDESDLVPGPYVQVCCADVDQGPIMMVLRVWDDGDQDGEFGTIGDHYSECMVQVTVQDKSIPELLCPADVTLQCGQEYEDINLTGSPSIGFVCNSIDAEYTDDLSNLADCNTGVIQRKWSVPVDGTTVECIQLISIYAPDDFDASDIVWAADWVGDCSDVLPDHTPQFTGAGACDQLGISLESDTFYFETDACYKILNYWKVRNWCTGEEYTDTQTIKIVDDTAPNIQVADAQFVSEANCLATVELLASADDLGSACPSENIQWSILVDLEDDGTFEFEFDGSLSQSDVSFDDSNDNDIPDVFVANTSAGQYVSIDLPNEIEVSTLEHRVLWTAKDGCGNTSTTTSYFVVEDQKAPTAACLNISSGLMINGELTLWACDFDASSSDNCTATEDLVFGFTALHPLDDPTFDPATNCTSRTFTCEDFNASNNGVVTVQIYVWDEFGNFSICESQLNLIDESDACEGNFSPMIAGDLRTVSGEMISNAEVILRSDGNEIMDTYLTDDAGNYAFEDVIIGNDYHVEVGKDTLYLNGISTLDLINIQQHILGIQDFDNPYQYIAADGNDDSKISSIDMLDFRKLILGETTILPNNESWRFIDVNDQMTNNNIWPFEEVLYFDDLPYSIVNGNFVGVKIGDVNFTASPSLMGPVSEVRSNDKMTWEYEEASYEEGEIIEVALKANGDRLVEGFQFTINHETLELIQITGPVDKWDESYYHDHQDKTSISWNDPLGGSWNNEDELILQFVAKANGSLGDVLRLSSDVTFAEAYDESGQDILGNKLEVKNYGFKIYQNSPNPFYSSTEFNYELPSAGDVTLEIYTASGQRLLVEKMTAKAGTNVKRIQAKELGFYAGVLTLRLTYEGEYKMIKLISVD